MTRRTLALRAMLWAERAFLVGALACGAWASATIWRAADYQRDARTAFAAPANREGARAMVPLAESARVPVDALIGVLDVPRLGLSVAVREGDRPSDLRVAVGHLPDTPLPWHDGNTALAGHRDTFFEPLRYLRVGDVMQLATPYGTFEYRVRRMIVVDPNEVWVLDAARGVDLTLITCYPFTYVGHAPQRFVVQAERES
jgi:sortase A